MSNEKQHKIAGPCTYCSSVDHWRPDCPELAAFVAREKIAVKCTEEIGQMLTDTPPNYEARVSDLIFAALEEHAEGLLEDGKMLDWLLEQMTWWECWLSYDMDNIEITRLLTDVTSKKEIGRGRTSREAVRSAMLAEKEKTDGQQEAG